MIRFELCKLWRNRLLLGFLAAFILLNIVRIAQLSKMYQVNPQFNEARAILYEQVRGTWNLDTLHYVIKTQRALEEQVMQGDYPTEPNQPGTYSGYVFGDFSLFTELYTEMDYMYHYEENNEKLLSDLRANADFYKSHGNRKDAEKNEKAISVFRGRRINAYYRTEGAVQWINYSLSSLLILISVLLCVSPCFSIEYETKMNTVLLTAKHSRMKIPLAKLASALISALAIFLLFSFADCICFLVGFPIDCLQNPIYSVVAFQNTPFSCSIAAYLSFLYACRVISVLLFTVLGLFFSSLTKSEMGAAVCSSIILLSAMIVGGKWNPVSLLTMHSYTEEYQSVSLMGYSVLLPVVMLLVGTVELFAAITATLLLYRKRVQHGQK